MGIVFLVPLEEEFRAEGQMMFRRGGGGGERRLHAFGICQLERAVDLVGGDMVEKLCPRILPASTPGRPLRPGGATAYLMTLVRANVNGSRMERSTWLSAAR